MRIFISNLQLLDIGGISTSLLNFLNELKKDNDITLCILSNYVSNNVSLPKEIRVIQGSNMLGEALVDRRRISNIGIYRKVRMVLLRMLKRFLGVKFILKLCLRGKKVEGCYDVAIAFSNNLYSNCGDITLGGDYQFVLNSVKARKKLAWIHNDAAKCGITRHIATKIFRDFDGIIHVSQNNKIIFDKIVPEYKEKSFVIYNMYDILRIKQFSVKYANPYENNGKIHLVTVCRLDEKQKKISRILEASKILVAGGYTNFDWKVVGDGIDRTSYEQKLNDYCLQNFIEFVGLKPNPYPYMKYADAFVLTSLYEGLGMANVEAQILNTPALVTDYGAAAEVVVNDINGIICENSVDGVVEMIERILIEPELLSKFRQYFIDNPVNNNLALQQFYEITSH
ncbi:glycosyltransferase [Parabacteroides faecis]|uniref:glycosyltransferase n=1 Tax=Parabacteroides faecis TaxID=1217282 RepID=UPI002164B7D0|nr:glycosyltransferase [Parabacteroides faecis]MCS2892498.1 glycosyltransferase [Parabacteroides faecis]UVQ48866.1 glycosyltransferase [Parabacteroides faecis]